MGENKEELLLNNKKNGKHTNGKGEEINIEVFNSGVTHVSAKNVLEKKKELLNKLKKITKQL